MKGRMVRVTALMRAGSMTLGLPWNWNCLPVVGSKIGISLPVPSTKSEKSPVFSIAVGTVPMPVLLLFCLAKSSAKKKKVRFLAL